MIRGTSTNVIFICDKCRAETPGVEIPIGNTGRTTAVEPEGWEKRVKKSWAGTVVRHYCGECR